MVAAHGWDIVGARRAGLPRPRPRPTGTGNRSCSSWAKIDSAMLSLPRQSGALACAETLSAARPSSRRCGYCSQPPGA